MRAEQDILNEIFNCYLGLSPENIWMDGEASHREARIRELRLKSKLEDLFKELGRHVTEDESFRSRVR
jgi:hypothetical protein